MVEPSVTITSPSIVCSKDITRATFNEDCIFYRDTEADALSDEEFTKLNELHYESTRQIGPGIENAHLVIKEH